jgi:putative oxidoreductase
MKALNNFLFDGSGATSRMGDFGLFILRAGFGLAIAIGHGMGKVYHDGSVGMSEQFLNGVKGMQLPAPTAMAWIAALTEFLGGILLAIGVFTRPVAIALVINMAVAAFVAMKDAPLFSLVGPNKEFPLLFLVVFLTFVFTGAGRFSVDKFLRKSAAAAHA